MITDVNVKPFFNSCAVQSDLLSEKMVNSPLRGFVIKSVKDPLRKVLIMVANRLNNNVGKVTKENTIYTLAHLLIDKKEKFFQLHHNPGRDDMLEAGWDVLISEVAHDPYYQYLFKWFIWEMIDEYKAGNMPELGLPPLVLKPSWR